MRHYGLTGHIPAHLQPYARPFTFPYPADFTPKHRAED